MILFYKRLFPFKSLFRWLNCGDGMSLFLSTAESLVVRGAGWYRYCIARQSADTLTRLTLCTFHSPLATLPIIFSFVSTCARCYVSIQLLCYLYSILNSSEQEFHPQRVRLHPPKRCVSPLSLVRNSRRPQERSHPTQSCEVRNWSGLHG